MFLSWHTLTSHRKCSETSSQSFPEKQAKGSKGELGRVRDWWRTNIATPYSSCEDRFEDPVNVKWLLFHLTPQTQILKISVVIPPSACLIYIFQGPPQRNYFSTIVTMGLQDDEGRLEVLIFGETERTLRHREVKWLAHNHTVSEPGQEAKSLNPLGVFSFHLLLASATLWICLFQQTSMFLSKSCQFFFPRWAMNLPRVSKQTVERALAFKPE